jgi:hypothetical protein
MNHTFIILKYLYKNNDKEYHPVIEAYKGRRAPGIEELLYRMNEISQLGYLEIRDSGKIRFARNEVVYQNKEPENIRDYKAKIKPKGEDYIDNKVFEFGNCIIKKNTFLGIVTISIFTILAIIIGLISN